MFRDSEFNPRIGIAVNPRLIEINNSDIFIVGLLDWNTDNNVWTMRYKVVRKGDSNIYCRDKDIGTFDNLGEAVELACLNAGIKSTDLFYAKRQEALCRVERAKYCLHLIKQIIGDDALIEAERLLCAKEKEIESAKEL